MGMSSFGQGRSMREMHPIVWSWQTVLNQFRPCSNFHECVQAGEHLLGVKESCDSQHGWVSSTAISFEITFKVLCASLSRNFVPIQGSREIAWYNINIPIYGVKTVWYKSMMPLSANLFTPSYCLPLNLSMTNKSYKTIWIQVQRESQKSDLSFEFSNLTCFPFLW